MPGLVGVVGRMSPAERDALLQDMSHALDHESWYQTHSYTDEGVGLGRVSLGILNPQPQPIWNEDKALCIFMEGEVYDYDDQKQQLIQRGHQFETDSDAEFVLHLYEEYGEGFALKLNGAFVAAIWDVRASKLRIVNDRFGLRPLFYRKGGSGLFFAGHTAPLFADPGYTPQVDLIAITEFLSFEHLLGDRTLVSDVKLLPPGSILTFQDGRMSIQAYYEFQFIEDYQDRDEAWYVERWLYLMRQAVERRMRGEGPIGVQLSGGLDSRVVLAMIDREHYPIHTFTFGIPGCDDARIAREVASRQKTEHHFFELEPGYLRDLAEQGVKLTNGLKSCAHMHGLGTLGEIAEIVDILHTGSLGDSIMGGHIQRDLLATHRPEILARMLFRRYNNCFGVESHSELFSPDFYSRVKGAVFQEFSQALDESEASISANRREHYSIRQNDRRWILEGQNLLRSQVVVRTPFYDNDLVDFMLSVPPGLRFDNYLYVRGFAQAAPDLAKVPYERTGLPFVPCAREVLIRLNRQVRWRLHRMGMAGNSSLRRRPYADYESWMRGVLRPWVKEILLDKRTLGRGYFNPGYIRNLVAEHMAGADHARKLGVLLSIELWHRLFLD